MEYEAFFCPCWLLNLQIYVEKKVHSENFSLNGESTGNFLEITLNKVEQPQKIFLARTNEINKMRIHIEDVAVPRSGYSTYLDQGTVSRSG